MPKPVLVDSTVVDWPKGPVVIVGLALAML